MLDDPLHSDPARLDRLLGILTLLRSLPPSPSPSHSLSHCITSSQRKAGKVSEAHRSTRPLIQRPPRAHPSRSSTADASVQSRSILGHSQSQIQRKKRSEAGGGSRCVSSCFFVPLIPLRPDLTLCVLLHRYHRQQFCSFFRPIHRASRNSIRG